MRLSSANLDTLPEDVARPRYERARVAQGVVHLGIGAFHRAHQAAIFDALLANGDLRWGITAVSMRSAAVREQLLLQDGLYTVVVRDGDAEALRVIGAVTQVLVAPDDPKAVVAAIAAPDTRLITLTVTEKGYKLDRAGTTLLMDDADVAHDLASLAEPRTVAGFLTAGLAVRRQAGHDPVTIMSCDNLPENGVLLRRAVLAMAKAHDDALHDWIADTIAFPATMVDRIVPATTEADVAALAQRLGIEDRAMVKTEPFTQWVIEDRFSGARPDFASVGANLTSDVAPWEEAKLRLLNGAHSGMAYLGGLAGISFVHQFVGSHEGRRFIEMLWDESAATLRPPKGLDATAYREALMARFDNPALRHRLRQIAQDGSQKLPQRLVAPVVERRARGQASPALTLALAAWMRWQAGRDDVGQALSVDDPLAGKTAELLAHAHHAPERVRVLLTLSDVFPDDWSNDAAICTTLAGWLTMLESQGAAMTLAHIVRN